MAGDGVLACSVYKTGAEGARVLSFLVREVGLKDDKANKQQETALHIAVSLTIRHTADSGTPARRALPPRRRLWHFSAQLVIIT